MIRLKNLFAILLFVLLLFTTAVFANENKVVITKHNSTFSINQLGFENKTTIKGYFIGTFDEPFSIYYSELQNVSEIKVEYSNTKQKIKTLNKKEFLDHAVLTSSFYDGFRAKSFAIPTNNLITTFKIEYVKSTSDIMFFPSLYLNDSDSVVEYSYQINYRGGLKPHYKFFGSKELLEEYEIDLDEKNQSINITSKPKQKLAEFDRTQRAVFKSDITPHLKMVFLPSAYQKQPFVYLNDWYKNLISEKAKLKVNTIKEFENEIDAESIFNIVKQKITYIAIENGLGAIQPRDVNLICEKKMGDCKDMANLLCSVLLSKNVNAKMAISATLSHPTNLDFADLSTANHAICVIEDEQNKDYIYLDATEKYGFYGWPSRQIQNKNIFIIDENGGKIHQVKTIEASKNKTEHAYKLSLANNTLVGNVNAIFNGFSALTFIDIISTYAEKNKINYTTKYFNSLFDTFNYGNLELNQADKKIEIKADVKLKKNINSIKNKIYIPLKSFPFPHNYKQILEENEKLVSYQTILNSYNFEIAINEDFEIKQSPNLSINNKDFKFNIDIKKTNATTLNVAYDFTMNLVEINADKRTIYNTINLQIKNLFNESIVLTKP